MALNHPNSISSEQNLIYENIGLYTNQVTNQILKFLKDEDIYALDNLSSNINISFFKVRNSILKSIDPDEIKMSIRNLRILLSFQQMIRTILEEELKLSTMVVIIDDSAIQDNTQSREGNIGKHAKWDNFLLKCLENLDERIYNGKNFIDQSNAFLNVVELQTQTPSTTISRAMQTNFPTSNAGPTQHSFKTRIQPQKSFKQNTNFADLSMQISDRVIEVTQDLQNCTNLIERKKATEEILSSIQAHKQIKTRAFEQYKRSINANLDLDLTHKIESIIHTAESMTTRHNAMEEILLREQTLSSLISRILNTIERKFGMETRTNLESILEKSVTIAQPRETFDGNLEHTVKREKTKMRFISEDILEEPTAIEKSRRWIMKIENPSICDYDILNKVEDLLGMTYVNDILICMKNSRLNENHVRNFEDKISQDVNEETLFRPIDLILKLIKEKCDTRTAWGFKGILEKGVLILKEGYTLNLSGQQESQASDRLRRTFTTKEMIKMLNASFEDKLNVQDIEELKKLFIKSPGTTLDDFNEHKDQKIQP